MTIKNFEEKRLDGHVITESMILTEILEQGWGPDKVVELRWINGDVAVTIDKPYGVLAKVIPNRQMLALLSWQGLDDHKCILSIVNADGSTRFVISNMQKINNKFEEGNFRGFTQSRIDHLNYLGAVFFVSRTQELYQLDIDAFIGAVIDTYSLPWG